MIPDVLATFSSRPFGGLSLNWFGILVGVVPLVVILLALSSVVKGRLRRGNGVPVFCLILMLVVMALLLTGFRSRRHTHIDLRLPTIDAVGSVKIDGLAAVLTPNTAILGGKVRQTEIAFDDRGELTASIEHSRGANAVAVTTRVRHRVPRFLERFRPKAAWSVLTGCAIAALMFVGYIALDAGTRGHFTWPLRMLTAVCFGAIITTVVVLRDAL